MDGGQGGGGGGAVDQLFNGDFSHELIRFCVETKQEWK